MAAKVEEKKLVRCCANCKHYLRLEIRPVNYDSEADGKRVMMCGHPKGKELNDGTAMTFHQARDILAGQNGEACGFDTEWFEPSDAPVIYHT